MTGFIPACILLVLFFNLQSQRINTDFLTAFPAAARCGMRRARAFARANLLLRSGMPAPFRRRKQTVRHTGGDAVLRQVSAYLEALGRRAVACRFSGVELCCYSRAWMLRAMQCWKRNCQSSWQRPGRRGACAVVRRGRGRHRPPAVWRHSRASDSSSGIRHPAAEIARRTGGAPRLTQRWNNGSPGASRCGMWSYAH